MKTTTWLATLAAVAASARAEVLHVPRDYTHVQHAVDVARDGDVIEIAKGVHRGAVNLQGKAITLRGVAGAELTALIGGEAVIRCDSGEGPATVIEGLTLAGGVGVVGKDGRGRGGGLFIESASPTVRLCMVVGNRADIGPGAWVDRGSPVFADCWFHDNESSGGPGVSCFQATPRFVRCGFHDDAVGWTDSPVVDIRPDCDGPGGACCIEGACVETSHQACQSVGGRWHEDVPCGAQPCPALCTADINHDRRVNHTDLLAVLNQWGMCR